MHFLSALKQSLVMVGLVPANHVFLYDGQDVDARHTRTRGAEDAHYRSLSNPQQSLAGTARLSRRAQMAGAVLR